MPTGTLVLPDPADVRAGVQYGAGGTEFTGTYTASAPPAAPRVRTGPGNPLTFGLPTTLTALLDAIEAQVATCLSIDPAYVFTSLDLGDTEATGGPADVFVTLTTPRGRVEQPNVEGGGPDDLATDATITLELWTRVDVDEGYRDTDALKNLAFGILARWRLLLNRDSGLQLFAPVATAGARQAIVREPMRLIDWDLRPKAAAAGWVKHVSRWEVKYLEDTTN